jgi:hypothetical protein
MWLAVDTYEDLAHLHLYYITSCDKHLGTPHRPGVGGGVVVEALRYKPECRGLDSRWRHWIFSLT